MNRPGQQAVGVQQQGTEPPPLQQQRAPGLGLAPGRVPGFAPGAAFPHILRFGKRLLQVIAFVGSLALLPLLWLAFWQGVETVRLLLGFHNPAPPWVPAALAGPAAWCVFYLATDHISLLGVRRARLMLASKTRRYLPPEAAPAQRFFVSAYTAQGRFGLREDVGYLCLLSDHLLFVGDRQIATFPRNVLTGTLVRASDSFRLGAAQLTLEMIYPWGKLQLSARDTATRLSDTHEDADRLEAALRAWLASD